MDDLKVMLAAVAMICIVVVIGMVNHYAFINNCIKAGLHQEQSIGSSSTIWVK